MSSRFQPIQIPPGVVAWPTKNMRSSNWAEVNLVRWIEGELTPVGGQAQYGYAFASRCKMIHGWYDLGGIYHIAYVCETNVYVDTAGSLTEITPAGGWPVPPLPTQGGYGDLNYGDDNYGTPRASGSILSVDKIPNVWSVDNFGALLLAMSSVDGRLLMWDPATGGVVTAATYNLWGPGQLTIDMAVANPGSVVPGMNVVNQTTGQAVGAVASYTGPLLTLVAPALSGGSAGDVLAFNSVLTRVANSPMGRCFVVTQERFVMIFGQTEDGTTGGGSARRFGWCDQENITAWNFSTVTSQAGFLDIEPASPIICAAAGKFGVIFFTAQKAYISRYLGLPYVYNYTELADECTPWSPASLCTTSSQLLWMSQQGMFSFDGSTITTVACLIRPWVTDDIDLANVREQACAVHIGGFNEFWWFFPQNGQPWNTRCIIYNYKEGWWSQGQMSRSAGVTSSYAVQPILADGLVAFQHELGQVYGHAAPPWAETFDLNLASGVRLVTLKQVIPDIKGDVQNVQFAFYYRNSRSAGAAGQWTNPVQIRGDGFVDARVTGRDLRMKISTGAPRILPFTLGQHLVDFAVRGDR